MKEIYVYCEIPFMSSPIEVEMDKSDAIKRFKQKKKVLDKRNDLISKMWFIGVQKRHNGKRIWIMKND
jgi:hypothetical protein